MFLTVTKLCIRFAAFVFCENYIFHKLLHRKENKKKTIPAQTVTALITLVLAVALPSNLQYFVYPVFILLSFIFATCITGLDAEMIFTTVIISYGIVFGTYALSSMIPLAIVVVPLSGCFHICLTDYDIGIIGVQILVSLTQILFCILPFRMKRLRKGMSFLQNKLLSKIGVFTGSLIIFCFTVICTIHTKMENTIVNYYLLLFAFVILAIIFLFIWWKNQIQREYIEALKKRELTQVRQQLEGREQQLSALQQENQELAKLLHRDNKQIPAMQLAVHEFMELADSVLSDYGEHSPQDIAMLKEKGSLLLSRLEGEMEERDHRSNFHAQSGKMLMKTNCTAIDQLLSFMLHQSVTEGIAFDFSLTGNVTYMLKEVIEEADCLTLLGDLLENARIATRENGGKHILLHIGVTKQVYRIDVWDSGAPFSKEVLFYLGKKRYTTRKKQGGSGIGLMSTYELAQKYRASLVIDETIEAVELYRKKISLVFDGKGEYRFYTGRDAGEIRYLSKRTDCIINEKNAFAK